MAPLEIPRLGSICLTAPVVAEAEALDLSLEVGDIFLGRLARMLAGLNRVLPGRQPEGIPTHWMQHMLATHAFKARQDIGSRVAFRMAHV